MSADSTAASVPPASVVPPARMRPMVFIAMPFGKKADPSRGCTIDFDAIYETGIKPALAQFGEIDFIRADDERSGGVIHIAMFERLLLAEVSIVDVTIDNANVYYELGVRHAARARSTIIISGKDGGLPFDIAMIRVLPYRLTDGVLQPEDAQALIEGLAGRVRDALADAEPSDSPLFQLIPALQGPIVPLENAECFSDRAHDADAVRSALRAARRLSGAQAIAAIDAVRQELEFVTDYNIDLFVDVLMSYEDAQGFDRIIEVVESLPPSYRTRRPVRERYAFALNRRNVGPDRQNAIAELQQLSAEGGASSETASIMAHIYKSLYEEALENGDRVRQAGHLAQAISWYRTSFRADPRNQYPGVNLLTLLVIEGSRASLDEFAAIAPAVSFAVSRLQGIDSVDYWVIASALEFAVASNDWSSAIAAFGSMSCLEPEPAPWKIRSTLNNVQSLVRAAPPALDQDQLSALVAQVQSLYDGAASAS